MKIDRAATIRAKSELSDALEHFEALVQKTNKMETANCISVYHEFALESLDRFGTIFHQLRRDLEISQKYLRSGEPAYDEDKPAFVYFVKVKEALKIGYTTDVKERLYTLKASLDQPPKDPPPEMVLLGTVREKSLAAAKRLEYTLHSKFQTFCLGREWFEAAPVIEQLEADGLLTSSGA